MSKTVIAFEHISKVFPGVNALTDVSLELHEGEVLALMGENRGGKIHAGQMSDRGARADFRQNRGGWDAL